MGEGCVIRLRSGISGSAKQQGRGVDCGHPVGISDCSFTASL